MNHDVYCDTPDELLTLLSCTHLLHAESCHGYASVESRKAKPDNVRVRQMLWEAQWHEQQAARLRRLTIRPKSEDPRPDLNARLIAKFGP